MDRETPPENTGGLTKRQAKAAETKRLVFETGKRLIAERGFRNVSVDDIVAECGVARGTFFFHFKSMGNFLNCVAQQNEPFIAKAVEESRGLPLLERIEVFAREWLGTLTLFGADLVRQLMTSGLDEPHESDEFAKIMLRSILQEAVEAGELAQDWDIETCERVLYAYLYGLAYVWCAQGRQDDAVLPEGSLLDPIRKLVDAIGN